MRFGVMEISNDAVLYLCRDQLLKFFDHCVGIIEFGCQEAEGDQKGKDHKQNIVARTGAGVRHTRIKKTPNKQRQHIPRFF